MGELVGGEGQETPVGAPGGQDFGVAVVGQLPHFFGFQVVGVQIGLPVGQAADHDSFAVGAPHGVVEFRHPGNSNPLQRFALKNVFDNQHTAPFFIHIEGESLLIWGPGAGAFDEVKLIDVAVLRRAGYFFDDFPGSGVSQVEVEAEEIFFRKKDKVFAVLADRRADVHRAEIVVRQDAAPRQVLLFLAFGDPAAIGIFQGARPGRSQRIGRSGQGEPDGRVEAVFGCIDKKRADHFVAVDAGDKSPKRLPPAVGEKFSAVQIAQVFRQGVVFHGVAHPQGGVRVDTADGEVLGQAFNHPKGQVGDVVEFGRVAVNEHMVLKSVHQLVAQYVVGLLVGHSDRENDAVAQAFRDAARTYADAAHNGIGLLKSRMIVVNDHGVFFGEGVLQYSLVHLVPEFGGGGEFFQFLGVVEVFINPEMFGFINFEIELLITRFVPPEILRLQGGSKQGKKHKK